MGAVVNDNNSLIISDNASALTLGGDVTSVTNNGEIRASDYAIEITPGATIGSVTNNGDLTGNAGIMNAGHITGDIINTGVINGGILNYGAIDGGVTLGNATLILAGNNASVGAVSGSNNSAVTIGRSDEAASFRAINAVDVGSISVLNDSRLLLAENLNWQADAISNNGTIVLGSGSTLTGSTSNAGTLTLSDAQNVNASIAGDVNNSGSLVLNPTPQSAGNTLTINGNYTGAPGSKISLGSVLGGDASLTDKLIINGNTTGSSALSVANEGGSGSSTLEGIQLVQVNGISDANFTLDGRVVAGAYDYTLEKGDASGSEANGWYLSSYTQSTSPGSSTFPGAQVNPQRRVRPEAASYADNLRAASTLFNTSLYDRVGETQYVDPLTGAMRTTSMWMRNVGGHNQASMSDGQNKTTSNRYVLQIGGDIIQWRDAKAGKFSLGIMGGYANQRSRSRNHLSGNDSRGAVDGYSTGLYGTWLQNADDKSGLYIDSWLLYSWFDNEVKGQGLAPETYKSHGLTASLESGYNYRASSWMSSKGMENSIWLQPHAQVIWMGVKADDYTESNGARIESEGDNNVQTRLGMRAFLNGKSALDKNSVREFQPFVEANWIYNSKQYGASMNGDKDHMQGARNIGELKGGVEGKLSSRLSMWLDLAHQIGGEGYSDTQGTLGVRYQF
ncbi:hypothetical protein BTJ39_18345 [Izhakiella australiensis]|uniref:Autotransporter domain-containing protein n=2 Tax=Izhakiella australiensis TaxID=1926881 RepID=A0A1S8YI86_9GAMM|nr:hypothetical protein BTJ39_18345 [Izhakiella australiensis]